MHSIFVFLLLAFSSTLVLSESPTIQISPETRLELWKAFNIDSVNHYVIPAYKKLDKAAQSLDEAIINYCLDSKKSVKNLDTARSSFHNTMDAWQAIQNIQFGPIQILMRNYSLQFWPDKKNHVGKHLAVLLSANDPASLTDSEFHKASVSIKGLPAIERFLFEEDQLLQLQAKPFHCQVLKLISSYTSNTSSALVSEWQDMKKQFENTAGEDGYFEDDIDATTTLLKALVEPIEVIRDLKLQRPLGSEYGQQKMKRLESWRSQRSLRNIQLNIESLQRFYSGLNNIMSAKDNAAINEQFNQILVKIKTMQSPIETSIETRNGFKDIKLLSDNLQTLHALLSAVVMDQGIHLGFNSRDGD